LWVGGDSANKINLNGLEPTIFDLLLLNIAWVQYNRLGMAISGIGPVIPGLGRQTSASLADLKSLFPSRAAGYISGAMAGGMLFGKLPGAQVFAAAAVGPGFFTFLAAMSTVAWVLYFNLAVIGFMAGIFDRGLNTVLVRIWSDEVAPYMSPLYFFFGIKACISPLIAAFVLEELNKDVKPALTIQAALCIPVAIACTPVDITSGALGFQGTLVGLCVVGLLFFGFVRAYWDPRRPPLARCPLVRP